MTKLKLLGQWLLSLFARLGNHLASGVPSLESGKLVSHGQTHIEDGVDEELAAELDRVITEAYVYGIAVNGDYYRYNAQQVAAAVSLGYLTTQQESGVFGRTYRPTYSGMFWVQAGKEA